jgi:hypothetical protein
MAKRSNEEDMKKPEKTGQKQDGRFQSGQSGNPAGRPRGARNQATMAALELLEGDAEKLTRKAIDLALCGDMGALRLCLERIVAPVKSRPLNIILPEITDASDLPKITAALLAAAAIGQIDPNDAAILSRVVEVHRGALEIADITERIKKLEDEVRKNEK